MRAADASTRRRGAWAIAALAFATLFATALTACEVPAKPAGGLFDSWKGNDADGAHAFASDAAVDQLFTTAWSSSSDWTFITCNGTAGATYCTWVNRVETNLTMKVNNLAKQVTEVTFTPVSSGVAGRFVHAWRKGDSATAQKDATAAATFKLFSIAYKASAHWLPTSCTNVTGGIRCRWIDDPGNVITVHYDSATKKVTEVTFEDCGCTPATASRAQAEG
ncbi:MAG: hypothetical protein U0P45_12095 [Acidimicrobiales bacterium]